VIKYCEVFWAYVNEILEWAVVRERITFALDIPVWVLISATALPKTDANLGLE
jgi:hypothetical protein